MLAKLAADLVVVAHFTFIAFVFAGGVVVVRQPSLARLHLPCAVYGVAVEFVGWICPLTPLENRLRQAAGEAGYTGGFVDHYVASIVYPDGLTRHAQWVLGCVVLLVNAAAYTLVVRRRRAADATSPPGSPACPARRSP